MKKRILLLGIILTLAVPAAAMAKTASESLVVSADEVIDGNFVRAANSITIEGTVNGDVIVGASSVDISGTVAGDVIVVAGTVEISGTVQGNVRGLAGNITLSGTVGRNTTIFGSVLRIEEPADIGWSLVTGAEETRVSGIVHGKVTSYGGLIVIDGTVGNDASVTIESDDVLTIGSTADIGGNLTYRGARPATIEEGAQIAGETTQLVPTGSLRKAENILDSAWIFGKLLGLFAVLFVGVVFVSLFPKVVQACIVIDPRAQGRLLFTGVLVLLATPLVIVILLISLIGAPLALILAAIFLVVLYLSKVIVGTMIGVSIFRTLRKERASPMSLFWPMMLGTAIVYIVVNIPFIGWAIGIIAGVWTLGKTVDLLRSSTKPS